MLRAIWHGFSRTHERLTSFFLPAATARDREASNRARMFLVSHLFGPFLGSTVPIALYAIDPTPGYDIAVLLLSILAFWVFPFLLRAGVAYSRLVVLSILNLHFAILWSCFFHGGVASPTAVWILIIPILAIFYIGGDRSLRPHLLVIPIVAFGAFFLADAYLPPRENDIPLAARLGLGATSTLATLCYMAVMAIYYARIFDAGVDLENEVKRRRRLAVELRSAVIAANRASSAKSEFLARMSHELRTPLNAIIGYGEILKEEAEETGDEPLGRDVECILDAGRYLVRLIDMILNLSRIEAGRLALHPTPGILRPLLEEAVAARRRMIEAAGNRIELTLSSAPFQITVDRRHLLEIIDSILENAAQHTRDGVIRVSASGTELAGQPAIAVEIADTGAGIAPEVLPTIFDAFAPKQQAAASRYGGTGLNLTVSSRICRALGGTISVDSCLGHGSTFRVVVPALPEAAERPGADAMSDDALLSARPFAGTYAAA